MEKKLPIMYRIANLFRWKSCQFVMCDDGKVRKYLTTRKAVRRNIKRSDRWHKISDCVFASREAGAITIYNRSRDIEIKNCIFENECNIYEWDMVIITDCRMMVSLRIGDARTLYLQQSTLESDNEIACIENVSAIRFQNSSIEKVLLRQCYHALTLNHSSIGKLMLDRCWFSEFEIRSGSTVNRLVATHSTLTTFDQFDLKGDDSKNTLVVQYNSRGFRPLPSGEFEMYKTVLGYITNGKTKAIIAIKPVVVKLIVPETAQRSYALDRCKMKVSEAIVAAAYEMDGTLITDFSNIQLGSYHLASFKYVVGQTVRPNGGFNSNPKECGEGIYGFELLEDAISYRKS